MLDGTLGEYTRNINNYDSNKYVIIQKKCKNKKLEDMSLENYINKNNNDFKRSHKKKRKKSESVSSIEFTEIINDNDTNKCVTIQKKHKNKKSTDFPLRSCLNINDNDFKSTPKKKKKKNESVSSIELYGNINAEENILGNTIRESTEIINDNDTNKSVTIQKKHKNKNSTDQPLRNGLNINNNDFKSTPKKKKKKDKNVSSIESYGNINAEENIMGSTLVKSTENINDNESDTYAITPKKYKNNKSTDLPLRNSLNINNNDFKSTPKKKKKKDKSVSSIELYGNINAEENIMGSTLVKSIENINDYESDTCVITSKKYKNKKSTDIPQRNSLNINGNDFKSTPKKKKKRDKNVSSIEFIGNINAEENILGNTIRESTEIINDNETNKSVTIQKKHKNKNSTDQPLRNGLNINDNDFKSTPKKKKKKDKNVSSIESYGNINAEENIMGSTLVKSTENINVNESDTYAITPKKYKNKKSTDIPQRNSLNINGNDFKSTPKKKKKQDKNVSSIESYGNINAEENIVDNTSDESTENMCANTIIKHESMELTDLPSINCVNIKIEIKNEFDENITENTRKNRSISVSNDHNSITNEQNVNNLVSGDLINIDRNINLQKEDLTQHNGIEILEGAKETYNVSCNNINLKSASEHNLQIISKYDNNISQKENEYKIFLDTIDGYELEENFHSIDTETKIKLNNFDLLNYLIDSNSSLKHQSNGPTILKMLTKQIKNVVNDKCQEVTQFDILLLQTIGKIILKKIIEKQNSAESIEDLHIQLPLECKNNKIHYIETSLSRQPKKEKMDIIKKHYPFVKLGVFNKEEDNIIRKYWSKFQQEYNISDILPFLSNGLEMALPHEERLQFFRFISAELPNRLLFSVCNRFNVLFNKLSDKLSFMEEEDEIILKVDSCDAIKNKFAVLSLILDRTRLQLYRRLNTLKMQPFRKKRIIWDSCSRQELFTSILLETNTDDWNDLKNMKIKKKTWIKIAERCREPINHEKAKIQWKFLSTMLFCEVPIRYSALKLTMLKLLLQINPEYWSDLNWVEITNKFYPGANSKVIVTLFHWWIHAKVPPEIRSSVRDSLNYLSTEESKIKMNEKVFPRLTVEDYDLLVEI